MKLTYSTFMIIIFTCIFALIALLLAINDFTEESFWLTFFTSFLLIVSGKKLTKNYTNFLLIFLGFMFLYGLSGPLNALYGEGLHRLFTQPYQTSIFLINYSLAIIGISIGMLVSSTFTCQIHINKKEMTTIQADPLKIIRLAVLFAVISTIFQLINFFRAGGFTTIGLGKAAFQSTLSELTLTLPSEKVALLAFALFSISLGILKTKGMSFKLVRSYIIVFLASLLPTLIIMIVLGRRGILLSFFLITLVGITYFRPIVKVTTKIVILFLVIYLTMGFLYANRSTMSYAFGTGNWDVFYTQALNPNRLVSALNPGFNEFGAAFGNFSEYINSGNSNFRLGETYFVGLLEPIPRFMYPGEKPQAIGYEFRDTFFPSEAERGTIAGTGFSSILEAYINFGSLGVLGIYFLTGILLVLWEHIRASSTSLSFIIFYLTMLPLAQSFHRSSLGMPFFWPAVLVILFWVSYYALEVFECKKSIINIHAKPGYIELEKNS